jgi:hypothetical protein
MNEVRKPSNSEQNITSDFMWRWSKKRRIWNKIKFAYHLITYIPYKKYIPEMKHADEYSLLCVHFVKWKMQLKRNALLKMFRVYSMGTAVNILIK